MGLDAVALCMPPAPRFDIACAALDAGFHVLCEKPPTPTLGELQALAAHAAARGRVLFTTWHSQYNAGVDAARRVPQGRRSEPEGHLEGGRAALASRTGVDWEPGGFGVLDPGINAFSILTRILPQPVIVASCTLEIPGNPGDPDCRAGAFSALVGAGRRSDRRARLATAGASRRGASTWSRPRATTCCCGEGAPSLSSTARWWSPSRRGSTRRSTSTSPNCCARVASHVDVAPLQLVADCLMLGRRVEVESFS